MLLFAEDILDILDQAWAARKWQRAVGSNWYLAYDVDPDHLTDLINHRLMQLDKLDANKITACTC